MHASVLTRAPSPCPPRFAHCPPCSLPLLLTASLAHGLSCSLAVQLHLPSSAATLQLGFNVCATIPFICDCDCDCDCDGNAAHAEQASEACGDWTNVDNGVAIVSTLTKDGCPLDASGSLGQGTLAAPTSTPPPAPTPAPPPDMHAPPGAPTPANGKKRAGKGKKKGVRAPCKEGGCTTQSRVGGFCAKHT